MASIDIYDETGTLQDEHLETVRQLLEYAATSEKIHEETEVSVTFTDNDKIQELNRVYRNLDKPTDVLSFALQEGEDFGPEEEGLPDTLGDIVVSVPKAEEQAEQYNHSFMRELGFLAVHGFLHLCGYDHMTEADEKQMFSRQKELMDGYGLER